MKRNRITIEELIDRSYLKETRMQKEIKKLISELNQALAGNESIPNCAICKWKNTQTGIITAFTSAEIICDAQAGKFAKTVYDNELCKKLYEKK